MNVFEYSAKLTNLSRILKFFEFNGFKTLGSSLCKKSTYNTNLTNFYWD